MDTLEMEVSLGVEQAAELALKALKEALGAEVADEQDIVCPCGRLAVRLLEVPAGRFGALRAVCLTVDSLTGQTRVHAAELNPGLMVRLGAYEVLERALAPFCL
jgi:hypothetical protein